MGASEEESKELVVAQGLFKDVKYYTVAKVEENVEKYLNAGGAKKDVYLSEMVTHVICDDPSNDEYGEAKELYELPVVSSLWVELSVRSGKQLPINAFTPQARGLLKGVVICPSKLSAQDLKSLWAMVTFYGGSCSMNLDKKCTHLVTNRPAGAKYECALRHQDTVKIVTPDWVVECIKAKDKMEEEPFHPRLLILEEKKEEKEEEKEETMETSDNVEIKNEQSEETQHGRMESAPMGLPQGVPPHQQPHHLREHSPSHAYRLQRPPFPVHQQSSPLPATGMHHPLHMPMHHPMQAPPYQYLPQTPPHGVGFQQGMGHMPVTPQESQTAREALAKMVNNRMQANGRVSETPEAELHRRPPPPPPLANIGTPPGSGGNSPRSGSPGRSTLRNITNNADTSVATNRQNTEKIQQIINSISRSASQSPKGRPGGQFPAKLQEEGAIYYGHDGSERVPEDMCLLGCVFYIADYNKYMEQEQLDVWKKAISQHGGQVDTSYSNRVTHLLCEHQESDVFALALKDQKRVVTAHWLSDVMDRKKMLPPWLATHFPSVHGHQKPCTDQLISVSGFVGAERARIKHMLQIIGAKYVGFLAHSHSALIVKRLQGIKYEKAMEWKVPVVNVQWLNDLVLGHMSALKLPVHSRYQQYNLEDDFRVDAWRVSQWLIGWKVPLKIPKDTWKRFVPNPLLKLSAGVNQGDPVSGNNKRKLEEAREEPPAKRPRTTPVIPGAPVVIFTGIPKGRMTKMEEQVEALGGTVTTDPAAATHLVTNQLARTVKFLICINTCQHIVTTQWLDQSSIQGHFLDESGFALKDLEAEGTIGCELAVSLQRARSKKLFQGIQFYITPSVAPDKKVLKTIVESAGGEVVARRPSARFIMGRKTAAGEPAFIVVTCDADMHIVRDLTSRKLPIFNAEFVLTGVLRQKIDYEQFTILGS
ncbi:PAX-interacting protein 1 [Lingula anatina]|uniref:PAX-interacting protein 1 n=1 Tax=Lingula anatina TaxID=7574 RepID=A0A1S3JJW9_LINAN|nr:PAX-interacting protein 1 [Lingula anatina]|eukprot:XP_013410668.1 PAX-interacting protein 1 [Lingula anatina]